MPEDLSVKADSVAWDKLCSEGGGKPHGETDGSAPVSNDSLSGGSMEPQQLGMTGNSGGVGGV